MMKRLALLPALLSAPLARGWVVQALEKIDDPVRPEFLAAIAELNDPPIRYIQPLLKRDNQEPADDSITVVKR